MKNSLSKEEIVAIARAHGAKTCDVFVSPLRNAVAIRVQTENGTGLGEEAVKKIGNELAELAPDWMRIIVATGEGDAPELADDFQPARDTAPSENLS